MKFINFCQIKIREIHEKNISAAVEMHIYYWYEWVIYYNKKEKRDTHATIISKERRYREFLLGDCCQKILEVIFFSIRWLASFVNVPCHFVENFIRRQLGWNGKWSGIEYFWKYYYKYVVVFFLRIYSWKEISQIL